MQHDWRGLSYIFVVSVVIFASCFLLNFFSFFFFRFLHLSVICKDKIAIAYPFNNKKKKINLKSTTSHKILIKQNRFTLSHLDNKNRETHELAVKQFFSNATIATTNANDSLVRIISQRKASWDKPLINRTL